MTKAPFDVGSKTHLETPRIVFWLKLNQVEYTVLRAERLAVYR